MIEKFQRALASLNSKKDQDSEKGFSLIELIVVVAILGILVAIAIPVFNGLQDRATRNAAESAASNAATQVSSQIASSGTFTAPAATEEFQFAVTGTPTTVDEVCVTVSAATGKPALPTGGDYTKGPGC